MIQISGQPVQPNELFAVESLSNAQRQILQTMASSVHPYDYASPDILRFELNLRQNLLNASLELYRSGARFSTFADARCNPQYWERTESGGFLLRTGVMPSAAINDIFVNGDQYAFECATAIPILYYKATLDTYSAPTFNVLFQNLYLFSWNHDADLDIETYIPNDYILGDVRYFKNPDVDPDHIEWQGLNVVILGDDRYYGHGAGIQSAESIIEGLNRYRRPGATRSAYLMKQVTRPDFKTMYRYSNVRPLSPPHSDPKKPERIFLQRNSIQESISYEAFLLSHPVTVRIGAKK